MPAPIATGNNTIRLRRKEEETKQYHGEQLDFYDRLIIRGVLKPAERGREGKQSCVNAKQAGGAAVIMIDFGFTSVATEEERRRIVVVVVDRGKNVSRLLAN